MSAPVELCKGTCMSTEYSVRFGRHLFGGVVLAADQPWAAQVPLSGLDWSGPQQISATASSSVSGCKPKRRRFLLVARLQRLQRAALNKGHCLDE